MRERKLTQQQAAALCGVDQPTLSKPLNGHLESIARWLTALGKSVLINVAPKGRGAERGSLSVRVTEENRVLTDCLCLESQLH